MADTVGAALVASDGTAGEPVSSLAAPGEEVREKRQFIGKELPEKLRWALLKIIADFMSQTQISRREYVKKCIRNHELFRGNAWGWYDYATGSYRRDFTSVAAGRNGSEQAQLVQSLYQLNVFQPFALSVIALLSSNKMTVKHWPENSHKPEDIEAARKHDLVYRAFQRSERHHAQLVKTIYHLWCDGTFGSYIRTVFDGDRFGYKDEPIVEHRPREIGPPSWKCVICGAPAEEPGFCVNPECGAPLPEGPNVPAPMAELPVVVGSEQIPRGRTVRDIVGGLELLLPPTCEELWEFPYLIRRRIVPKSTVRAAYPEMWRDIGSRGDGADDSVTISLERRAQLQATLGTSVDNRALPAQMMDHVFYAETWLRRTAFYQEEDEEIRDQLLDMFPDGLCVVTADDLFLEARAERMDDHWRICHALPGKGQIREPIGGSLVQIQEIINDLVNIIRDTIEFTLPMTFVDQGVFDIRKLGRSANAAGMMYNATKQGGRPIGEGFFQTQPGQVSQYAVQFLNDLRTTWAQFASGAFPAAYGGGTPGNSTAAGIEVERNSALGRISLYLRCLTEHWAQCAPLVIKDYRENGTEPLTVVDKAPSGDYKTDSVTPEDIEIGSAKTMPELDEEYPVTWPQRQAALLQMFANPMYQGMLALISNAGEIKRTLGHDLKVPGEDAYEFQHKLIKRLLEEAPLPGPPQPVMMPPDPNALVPDPATGQMVPAPPQPAVDEFGQPMMQPGPPVPSIQPQQIEDHLSMLQACIDFYYSEEGQARGKNPDDPGWQNFMLHAAQRQAAALEQVQTMPPMQPGTPPIPAQVASAQPPQVPPPMDPNMMGLPLDQTGGMPPMPT